MEQAEVEDAVAELRGADAVPVRQVEDVVADVEQLPPRVSNNFSSISFSPFVWPH